MTNFVKLIIRRLVMVMDANVEQAVGCPMAELVLVKRTTEPVRKISSSLIAKMNDIGAKEMGIHVVSGMGDMIMENAVSNIAAYRHPL